MCKPIGLYVFQKIPMCLNYDGIYVDPLFYLYKLHIYVLIE